MCPLSGKLAGSFMSSVTVLSGPERRRRWSAAEKASIVKESLGPGAVVSAVAQRHDVHPNLLHHWRRQAKQTVSFVPVTVSAEKAALAAAGGRIEIDLGSGVRVRVDAGVDEMALSRVLRALGR